MPSSLTHLLAHQWLPTLISSNLASLPRPLLVLEAPVLLASHKHELLVSLAGVLPKALAQSQVLAVFSQALVARLFSTWGHSCTSNAVALAPDARADLWAWRGAGKMGVELATFAGVTGKQTQTRYRCRKKFSGKDKSDAGHKK